MIYNAIGLQLDTTDCMVSLREEPDFSRNLANIRHMTRVAIKHSLDYPAKLIALSEGAVQGFPDEIHDWDSVEYARRGAIDVPGPVTDELAEIACEYGVYMIAQAKIRREEFPGHFFNSAIVFDPSGQIVLRHHKNVVFTPEGSTTPHDVYSRWTELFGEGLDAFFPVVQTEIGTIGCAICMEGNFPESLRGLTLNGAEIIYRPSSIENKVTLGLWEIQNQVRALDNQCYILAPNTGRHFIDDEGHEGFFTGGHSMIVDYRGTIQHINRGTGNAFCIAPVNLAALREHRSVARHLNWLPFLRTEIYRLIYSKTIYPPDVGLQLEQVPRRKGERDAIVEQTVEQLQRDGVFARNVAVDE
jgi:predicted amidohydrolase